MSRVGIDYYECKTVLGGKQCIEQAVFVGAAEETHY